MISETMNLTLRVWRQDNAEEPGRFEEYKATDMPRHVFSGNA